MRLLTTHPGGRHGDEEPSGIDLPSKTAREETRSSRSRSSSSCLRRAFLARFVALPAAVSASSAVPSQASSFVPPPRAARSSTKPPPQLSSRKAAAVLFVVVREIECGAVVVACCFGGPDDDVLASGGALGAARRRLHPMDGSDVRRRREASGWGKEDGHERDGPAAQRDDMLYGLAVRVPIRFRFGPSADRHDYGGLSFFFSRLKVAVSAIRLDIR